jgi:hypothetical protein
MPICNKCNEVFPNRKKIDGKWRQLSSRKYCTECSPWGLHNTRAISPTGPLRSGECISCGRAHKRKSDLCKSCATNLRRFSKKSALVGMMGGKCVRCGYSKCLGALHFHHRDSSDKEFPIGRSHCLDWETLKREAAKCDLMCSNCHSELHWDSSNSARRLGLSLKIWPHDVIIA